MGVVSYLDELNELRKAKKLIHEVINEDFTLDTNILVILAMHREVKLLDELIYSKHYIFTKINLREINGLVKGKRFDPDTNGILNDFVQEIMTEGGKAPEDIETNKAEAELKRLLDLLPRKIAFELLISQKNSFLLRLIQRFEEMELKMKLGRLTQEDQDQAMASYKSESEQLSDMIGNYALDQLAKS